MELDHGFDEPENDDFNSNVKHGKSDAVTENDDFNR